MFGVEANINATNAHGARPCQVFIVVNCEDQKDWIGTATARAGYAFWNRGLLYGRAGVAFTNTTLAVGLPRQRRDPDRLPGHRHPVACRLDRRLRLRIRADAELDGSRRIQLLRPRHEAPTICSRFRPSPTLVVDVREKGFISTVGLNYRFAPGVVVAKY